MNVMQQIADQEERSKWLPDTGRTYGEKEAGDMFLLIQRDLDSKDSVDVCVM